MLWCVVCVAGNPTVDLGFIRVLYTPYPPLPALVPPRHSYAHTRGRGALPSTPLMTPLYRLYSMTKNSSLQRRSLGARPQPARHIPSGHGASCEGAHRGLSRVDDHEYRLGAERVEGQSGTLSIVCAWEGRGGGEGLAPRLAASRIAASCVRIRRL
eukprot:scaffold97181_cov70-Phaeocystis_antarctica.AAC.5